MKTTLTIFLSTLLLATAVEADSPLKTAEADHREMALEHQLDGVVEAANQGTLTAQTQGRVVEVLVDVDEYVEKDSLIIRLRDTEQKARLVQAKADLKQASARLEEIKKQHGRITTMHAKGLISATAMDQTNSNLRTAEAQQTAAQAGLKAAEEQLEYTNIKAPFSGIVTQRHIEAGETASPGKKLISGLSLEKLRVNVNVPQSLIQKIKQGGKARIQLPDNKLVEATNITVFPYAQSGSNTFKVRLDLPASVSGLFPGMYVKTAFMVGKQKRLTVPQQAVVFRSEVTGVYVVDKDGKLTFRHIRLGEKLADNRVAILAGLDQKEQIAIDPIAAGAALKQQMQNSEESNGE